MADIHIVRGDLEALSASVSAVRDKVRDLDIAGTAEGVASSMPGAASAGMVKAAAAEADGLRATLGGQYEMVSDGVLDVAAIHRRNDSAVAASTPALEAGTTGSKSAQRWARAKGLS